MQRRTKSVLAVAAVLMAAGGLVVLTQVMLRDGPVQGTVSPAPAAGAEFRMSSVWGRHRGERQWHLEINLLREEGEWVVAEGIDTGTIYRDGEPYLRVRGRSARWHQKTNDLVLEGDVVVVHADQTVFLTERLEWKADTEVLTAPGPVEVRSDGDVLRADGMEADFGSEQAWLSGNVLFVGAGGDRLRAARALYDMRGRVLRLAGAYSGSLRVREADDGHP